MSAHVRDRLSAHLDGELEAAERDAVERHLESCHECATLLEELDTVDRAASELQVAVPPAYFEGFAARVRKRIRATPARSRFRIPTPWALAAAAALIAVVTPLVVRQPAPPATQAPVPPAALSDRDRATQAPSLEAGADRSAGLKSSGYVEAPARSAPESSAGARGLERPRAKAAAPVEGASSEVRRQAPAAPPPAPVVGAAARGAELDEEDRGNASEPTSRDERLGQQAAAVEGKLATEPVGGTPKKEATDSVSRFTAPLREEAGRADEPAQALDPGALSAPGAPPAFRKAPPSAALLSLLKRRTTTIAEARGLREAWRAFARAAAPAEADEALVRVVETGLQAWQLSREEADLAVLRRDATAYLKREDAAQKARVRGLLEAALRPE